MDLEKISKQIIDGLGGVHNISYLTNCMTRVRATVKDTSKVDIKYLKSIDVVISVIEDETMQVVVGPGKSKKIGDYINENYVFGNEDNNEKSSNVSRENVSRDYVAEAKAKKAQNNNGFKKALKKIANIFVPLIPAIIAAGLCNGIAGYFENTLAVKGIKDIPLWITFLKTVGGALFGYLSIYVGINAAKEFGATPGLGGIIGGITISTNIDIISKSLGLFNESNRLKSILISGKGGIIGVIVGVAILAFIEKRIRKIVPDMLDNIVTPLVSVGLTALLTVFLIMPAAGFLSDILMKILEVLIMTEGPMAIVGGFILSASFLPLLMVGLHHGLIPFYVLQLEKFGSVSLFPVLCMAGAGQIGAAAAIYLKAKGRNEKLRNVIRGALPVGLLGIGEPLLYGVTLPLGTPFITASLAGGFAGAFCASMKVSSIAYGPAGLTAIPLMLPNKMIYYFISLCIAYVLGFVFTYLIKTPKAVDEY